MWKKEQEWITGGFIQLKGSSIFMCKVQLNGGVSAVWVWMQECLCFQQQLLLPALSPAYICTVTSVTWEPPGVSSLNPPQPQTLKVLLRHLGQSPASASGCLSLQRLEAAIPSRQMESKKGVPAFLCPWWSFSTFPAMGPLRSLSLLPLVLISDLPGGSKYTQVCLFWLAVLQPWSCWILSSKAKIPPQLFLPLR